MDFRGQRGVLQTHRGTQTRLAAHRSALEGRETVESVCSSRVLSHDEPVSRKKTKKIDSLKRTNALFSLRKQGGKERKASPEPLAHCPTFLLASQPSRDLGSVGSTVHFPNFPSFALYFPQQFTNKVRQTQLYEHEKEAQVFFRSPMK